MHTIRNCRGIAEQIERRMSPWIRIEIGVPPASDLTHSCVTTATLILRLIVNFVFSVAPRNIWKTDVAEMEQKLGSSNGRRFAVIESVVSKDGNSGAFDELVGDPLSIGNGILRGFAPIESMACSSVFKPCSGSESPSGRVEFFDDKNHGPIEAVAPCDPLYRRAFELGRFQRRARPNTSRDERIRSQPDLRLRTQLLNPNRRHSVGRDHYGTIGKFSGR